MKRIILLLTIAFFCGCTKKLELKPDSSLIIPKSVQDLENLLDNADEIINCTPALAQLSSDEYFITDFASWQSLPNIIQRNTYIWNKDIFGGERQIPTWLLPYTQIFYSNSVIDVLDKQNINNNETNNIRGWALFVRAYAFYTLVSNYSKAYDPNTSNTDLGIPIKLSSDITEIVQRSTLQQTYDQIIKDVLASSELLKQDITIDKRNRPSKVAAYALLSRIYLSMRRYEKAEFYADKSLAIYSKLTDYNTLTISDESSFTINSSETIYFTAQLGEFPATIFSTSDFYGVDTTLINLYAPSDLRIPIFFTKNSNGYSVVNKGINNDQGPPFTGLAVDELYLIKAECLARRQQKEQALSFLNELIKARMQTGAFIAITANDANDALEKILTERRKELIWRGLRWTDLKRLNLEGRNITLIRKLDGQIFTLEPNSPKYVFPFPDDEVALTGIQQNIR